MIMELQKGSFLKSTDPDDATFAGATIFISECNENGAAGFIINRPYGRSLNELEEFKNARSFPLYEGGPVDQEHLFFLHRRPDLIEGATPVGAGIYMSGNFSEAVEGINSGAMGRDDLKLFLGYCGWEAGELEAEIGEGYWTLEAGDASVLFN
jgi:putative transcriptional regulator